MRYKHSIRACILLFISMVLAGCGSGGTVSGGSSGSNNTSTSYSIALALFDSNNVSASHLVAGSTATAVATVTQITTTTNTDGSKTQRSAPTGGQIVVFTTSGASVTPTNGNVLSDSNGKAAIVLTVGTLAGAYSLTGLVQGGNGATTTLNYLVDKQVVPQISLAVYDSSGQQTSTLIAGTLATVKVVAQQLTQTVGQPGGTLSPAAGAEITFSSDGGTFDPTNGTVLTDSAGNASIQFQPKVTQGVFNMSASATLQESSASASTKFTIEVPTLVMGSGSPFQAGVLQVLPTTVIGGGQVSVQVLLQDGTGNPFTLPVQVVFTSGCVTAGSATITSPVPAISGKALTTYVPGTGCLGKDTIEAQVTLPGQTIPNTATGSVNVIPPPASGIVFVSDTPKTIAIRGHGTASVPERSTVLFTVVSSNGVVVPGQQVNFTLSSLAGGIHLVNSSAVSDSHGQVSTVVISGAVTSTVTVHAELPDGSASADSGPILISTASAEQKAFSISATQLDIEAWDYDGITTTVNIRAADHYSNPVPDGTVISFTADGGSVSPSCTIAGGACSVTMTSQNPRPANGRVAVFATAVGDETFTDINGDGLYEVGEPFGDLGEPYRDDNENGRYDSGEYFIDVNSNGRQDGPSGVYQGSLCAPNANPCNPKGTYVREQIIIVFATSAARMTSNPATIQMNNVSPVTARISVSDLHGNLPPAGTTLAATTSAGTILGDPGYTIGDSDAPGPLIYTVQLIGDGSAKSGVLTITLKTPKGATTILQVPITQTVAQLQVGTIALNPNTFTVGPNQTRGLQTQAVFTSTAPAQAMPGVTPSVNCNVAGSTGIDLQPQAPSPTDGSGATLIVINSVTTATPTGTAACTVSAGTQTATLTVKASP